MIQKLGKYAIVEKLGEGAMGAVYKAYDEILDRHVAIKTMAEDIKWDPELKLRFYREARSAASLHHPNIVTIHDLGEEGKVTYIVMEFLEGKDLKTIIRDREPLSLEQKLTLMAQVAEGLQHAHARGIIHRDIKPGNIHVTPGGVVKILDFGIARLPSSDLTRSGVRLGTPVYMSPEQIRGGDYDARSDIFSTGIVFYELLTYTHPFRDKNIAKTLDNILFQTKLPFDEHLPEAPSTLWPLIQSCLEKDPKARCRSLADLARSCRKLLDEIQVHVQMKVKELQGALPRLRRASESPGAPAPLQEACRDAIRLLNQEDRPGLLSLEGVMHEISLHAEFIKSATATPPQKPPEPAPPATPPPPPEPSTPSPEELRGRELFEKGKALLKESRLEEAIEPLRQATGLLGPREDIVKLLGEARRRIEEQKETRIAEFMDTARKAVASVDFAAAVESLDEVLQLEPDRTEAVELRRKALAEIEAEKEREQRRIRGEQEKEAGLRHLAERRFREALEALERAGRLLGEDAALLEAAKAARAEIEAEERRSRARSEVAQAAKQFQAGALDDARARASRALELEPDNAEARNLLGKINKALEKRDRERHAAAILSNIQDALDRRSFEVATALLKEGMGLLPGDNRFESMKAKLGEAKEELRRQQEIDLLLSKSRDALARQDLDGAAEHAEEVLRVEPNHQEATRHLQSIDASREAERQRQAIQEEVLQGQQAFLRQELELSEEHARRALRLDPGSTKAQELLVRIEEAREERRREEKQEEVREAELALANGDLEAVEGAARRFLERDKRDPDARRLLSAAETARKARLDEAVSRKVQEGREALQQRDLDRAAELAMEALDLRKADKAAKALLKGIERERRALQKMEEKERKRVEKEQRAAAARGPEAAMDKTVVLPSGKKWLPVPKAAIYGGGAALALIAALLLWMFLGGGPVDSTDTGTPTAGAQALLAEGRIDEAIAALQAVLADDPDNAEARGLLEEAEKRSLQKRFDLLLLEAQTLRADGRLPESLEKIQEILAQDPANEAALAVQTQVEAELSRGKSLEEQEVEIRGWLARAASLIGAGRLVEANAQLEKVASLRPDHPELAPLRRRHKAKGDELARARASDEEAESREKIAEWNRTSTDLFRQGKYEEAQKVLAQWLTAAPNHSQATSLRAKVAEALNAEKGYQAALSSNHYDDALQMVADLERINPADPSIPGMRSTAESRKSRARALISIFRLGDPGQLLVDGQPIGEDGQVENHQMGIGSHTLAVRNSRGQESTLTRQFTDGEAVPFVYDLQALQLRPMAASDVQLLQRRREREQIHRFAVEHDHGFFGRNCKGELVLNALRLEYITSRKEDAFAVNFDTLKLKVDGDKLEFLYAKDNRGFEKFKAASAAEAKSIQQIWEKLEKLK